MYKYFTDRGDPKLGGVNNMDVTFMRMLDGLREQVGYPINIHAGFARAGHSPNSMHYKGMAVDCSCPDLSLEEFYTAALKFQKGAQIFTGIGLYPFWNSQGIHLDIRTKPLRWVRDHMGNYIYDYSLDELNNFLGTGNLSIIQQMFCPDNDSTCDQ